MTNAEKLEKWIEAGHWVGCKDEDGEWKVFIHKTKYGFEGFGWDDTIKESIEDGLSSYAHTAEEINDETIEMKIVTPAPKLLPIGTKVRVLENCREMLQEQEKVDIIGSVYKINRVVDNRYEIPVYNGRILTIPHWAVAEVFEDEKKEDFDEGFFNSDEMKEAYKKFKSKK